MHARFHIGATVTLPGDTDCDAARKLEGNCLAISCKSPEEAEQYRPIVAKDSWVQMPVKETFSPMFTMTAGSFGVARMC